MIIFLHKTATTQQQLNLCPFSPLDRHGVNSISELVVNSGIAYLELEIVTNKLDPQINLPINFLIQKYFFHDNSTWNINYSE